VELITKTRKMKMIFLNLLELSKMLKRIKRKKARYLLKIN